MSPLIRPIQVTSAVVFVCLFSSPTNAQVREFPYRAKVEVDEAFVRSGGGEQFFATQKLVRGDEVVVHQHHAGGWFQIEPPEGSYSWIPQRYIDTSDGRTGTVKLSGVVAYIGSEFGKDISVFQRRMNANEEVEIISKEVVETTRGPEPMYRIRPPVREWRYIPGQAVVPVDASLRRQRDNDPYVVPSTVGIAATELPGSPDPAGVTEAPPVPSDDVKPSLGMSLATSQLLQQRRKVREYQETLKDLDSEFRSTLARDTSAWDFETIEDGYEKLRTEASHPAFTRQIALRITAIRKYERIKAEYDDFIRLTSETEKRDAELMAAQFGVGPQPASGFTNLSPRIGSTTGPQVSRAESVFSSGIDGSSASVSPFGSSETSFPPLPNSDSPASGGFDGGTLTIPGADDADANASSAFDASQGDPRSQYVGAGIIQKSARLPGKPDYVLLNPAGKILAYVNGAENIDLNEHLGNAVGLHGKRWYRDDIAADFIEVSGLQPVKIRR